MVELTSEQLQQLDGGGWPPRVANPSTGETFVLLNAEMYERLRTLLEQTEETTDVREMYPLLAELDPEDWDDRSVYVLPSQP